MSPLVQILGQEKAFPADENATLLDVLLATGFSVSADCGGKGRCGRCKVKVVEGATELPPSQTEMRRLSEEELAAGFRLACQQKVAEGLVLEVVEEIYRREVYKRLGIGIGKPLPLAPHVRKVPLPEGKGLEDAFEESGLSGDIDWAAVLSDAVDPRFLRDFDPDPSDSRPPHYQTALTNDSGRVIGLCRPDTELHGIAVDLGTTTIAVYLCNLERGEILGVETARNPQVSYGADVMSRIKASQDPQNAAHLQELARKTINSCITTISRRHELPLKSLVDAVVVGNPTMIHLLLGAHAQGLAVAPYRPIFHSSLAVRARDLGFSLHPGAAVHTLPLPSAFVGADTVAAWLWAEREIEDRSTLLLDLGTNGEMVLSAKGGLWATSCATGPAFEGATLTCGMAGIPGAVERVHFKAARLVLKIIGSSTDPRIRPRGICGSGAMSVLAALLQEEILRPDGGFEIASGHKLLQSTPRGVHFVLAPAKESASGKPVVLHQKDIRDLQFAKGAVATGIRFLCDAAGIDAPERILLAGAFGNVIDPEDALTIGLIPEVPRENIRGIGNAAGLGACKALLDIRARKRARDLLREIRVVELGGAPGFKEAFFANLSFPRPDTTLRKDRSVQPRPGKSSPS
ncbi:MAG TPA: ASKHA domain-containing protein [Syntrophobacteraceae bacterium]|nr:ASKHA domain-containing protein [Syntrophobacteraceae bacterium]